MREGRLHTLKKINRLLKSSGYTEIIIKIHKDVAQKKKLEFLENEPKIQLLRLCLSKVPVLGMIQNKKCSNLGEDVFQLSKEYRTSTCLSRISK